MARLSITIPDDAYSELEEFAEKSKRVIADIVREALDDYLKSQGIEVSTKVKRGGDRRPKLE